MVSRRSQATINSNLNYLDDSFPCNKLLDSSFLLKNILKNQVSYNGCAYGMIVMKGNNHTSCRILDFEDLEFDAPLNVPLSYLQFSHRGCQFNEILGAGG